MYVRMIRYAHPSGRPKGRSKLDEFCVSTAQVQPDK